MKTIEEVLEKIDQIIKWSIEHESPIGYFAATYRVMTSSVLKGVQNKKFENNARMVDLDIAFASRYFDAFDDYQKTGRCTNAWYLAFEAAKNKNYLILQHLFLGINAHINLDLGIAAASIMPYGKIKPLQNDFNKINTVISSINQNVQDSLNEICYPVDFIDKISNGKDNAVLDFAISKARETSWTTAVIASKTPLFLRDAVINIVDYAAARVGTQILNPKLLTPKLAAELRRCESTDVVKNIEILANTKEF